MGSDLFGSYAESSCAALFVASISSFGAEHNLTAMMYPLLISAVGLLVCAITTVVATDVAEVKESDEVGPALKRQILISTVLMTAGVAAVTFLALPPSFTLFDFGNDKHVKNWYVYMCCV
jgi:inorganic pyrophosphatase